MESFNVKQRQGILFRETMFALKHTVSTACHLSEYLLTDLQFHYVLLGKFQTDPLEFRFGQYRQMSGGNYHVSVTQITESEKKKLRIMSVMNVVTRGGGHLTLRDFIASCQKEAASVETATSAADGAQLSQFSSVIVDCDSILISDAEMSSIVFIAGYVGFKLKSKLSCIDCRLELLTDRALECDFPRDESFNYLASIDRGGLTWPTELMVEIVAQTIIVFKCLVSAKYCKQFNMLTNQRSIMTHLACQRCIQVAVLSGKCSSCGIVICRSRQAMHHHRFEHFFK